MTEIPSAVLRKIRADLITVGHGLTAGDWEKPSACPGWTVKDVYAHVATELTPRWMVESLRADNIEAHNDRAVERWRGRSGPQVLQAYERLSGIALGTLPLLLGSPLGRLRAPLGELGRHPLAMLANAVVFDWWVHLHLDILAPSGPIEAEAVPVGGDEIAAMLVWMFAGVGAAQGDELGWLPGPVAFDLEGPGGGVWVLDVDPEMRRAKARRRPEIPPGCAAVVRAAGAGFPSWATQRTPWRDASVKVEGDTALATRVLDTIRVV